MNLAQSAPVPAPDVQEPPAPTCRLARLQPLPGIPSRSMSCCPLLMHAPSQALLDEFRAAPQFAQIQPGALLRQSRGYLAVILLADSDYYARQAALYLASLSAQRRAEQRAGREDDSFWDENDLKGLFPEEDTPADRLENALAVLSPALLDPDLYDEEEDAPGRPRALPRRPDSQFDLVKLPAPAALIAAPSGPVLSEGVLDQIRALLADRDHMERPMDLFLALKPGQVDSQLLEELRFTSGFQVCRVGRPDRAYLGRVLTGLGEAFLCPVSPQADLDRVIAHTMCYRGEQFSELDLESLICWAVQRQAPVPLRTQDLLFQPYGAERRGMARLDAMVGLSPAKETLRRLLARAVLEGRRLRAGKSVVPACRNLAFSGPPGTGKSVTARLLAQILREEGVGTGRFVEAGREQLIGAYLGQTSPMIARLFQRARGGVLFIDEAGALLDNGRDAYAVEAVNALVRHMELEPETMVILATYPGEMERLLASNPGLSSRVAHVLDFGGYDDGQLWDILGALAAEGGYRLPGEGRPAALSFFRALRRKKGDSFGNGREARRLFQTAVEELALRVQSGGGEDELSPDDLARAAQRLLAQSNGAPDRPIGF